MRMDWMLQLTDKSGCLSVVNVVHTYFYIVVDTQQGCHTLK